MRAGGPASTEAPSRDVSIVLAELDLDKGLSSLRWGLHDALAASDRNLIVDCTHVPALSPVALRSLLGARRACRARGGRVELDQCEPSVLETVHGSGLARVFLVRPAARGRRTRQRQTC